MPPLRTHDPLLPVSDADSTSLPTLDIIAPTPRAFTFPISHNLDASPYSDSIDLPFEPDLCFSHLTSPPSSNLLMTPPLSRTLTPIPSASSASIQSIPSSSSSGLKSATFDAGRKPKKGDDGYIKRPENAFILFRRKCCEDEEASSQGVTKRKRQADLSKLISQQWKALTTEERRYWEDRAEERKKIHQKMYPDYVFRPQRVRDQDGKARNKKYTKRKASTRKEDDTNEVAFVLPQVKRSTSAPTPPPSSYQTIHIPTLIPSYTSTSSSLLPMISQRAGHVGDPEDIMANFDFCPESLSTPSYSSPRYEAGLWGTDLHQEVFDYPIQEPSWTESRDEARFRPPVLSTDYSLIPSCAASNASSPVSGPFTPISSIASHTSSGQWFDVPRSNTWNDRQQEFASRTVVPIPCEMNGFLDPCDPSMVWRTEASSMLLQSDFDLDVIPPIELKLPLHGDSASHIDFPSEELTGDDKRRDLKDYLRTDCGLEFWSG
ncbi:hypothetical protein EV360DRAFT_81595 [Lentinula raphanica]|nr:hypothetical protein EV360DRAFT_81595 [Lentinula raphanica]